ncbi:glutamyl aminopeptidase [Streptococcus sp. X16XC17]|uniref:glutamyl aminopeptidase n=1 Tax=Streptococcus sp. X16XC17 TaxID=2316646 RepID=UPI001038BD1B|nr:glutamyl aminopeptidase [Streptococcus sp. X16XC17]TCD45518.1 glutamyl aminopeptidase [Streptococcus sp. X16XC17]
MTNHLFEKIKEVTELYGVSGFEGQVRDYLRNRLTPHVDRIETDGIGSIFGIKETTVENAPRIMVAGHMDEVGFMISDIKTDGTFRTVALGGWNPLVVSSQRFTLYLQDGRQIPVISGSIPPHLAKGINGGNGLPSTNDVIFDAGFASKEEAFSYGVRPGDVIVPISEATLTANGKNVISKAWDNRYGVLMAADLAENVAEETLPNQLIVGATVQEEVGLRGAHTAVTKFNPDIFLAVDCSPAGDVFGDQGAIGDGTLLRFYDPDHILLPNMKDFLLTTAEEAGVKFQYYCGKGGTDAGAAHMKNHGVPSTTIGVCARYIHSHQTLYSMDDFIEAQTFLQAIVKKLDRSTVDLIKHY